MPKRILVIGDSMSLAHAARAMVVARRLIDEGADVEYATGPAHQQLARNEGFDPHEVYCVDPSVSLAAIRRGSHIFTMANLKRYIDSDHALIEKVKPDLIVTDFRMTLNISAQQAGVPYWSIMNGYVTHYYAAPMRPPRTMWQVRLMGDRVSRALMPMLKRLTLRGYAAAFRKIRRRAGLPPINNIFDVIESPHRNLIADLPRFVPCANLPPHFQYIGPLVWEPRVKSPEWLSTLQTSQAGKPTVYVSMGSSGGVDDFQLVLTTLRDAGYRVLTTLGTHGEAPPDVLAAKYAPGSAMLRHADVMVCHGGSGTIYQAVAEGVPVVAIPTFHDQEINVERLEAVGWGVGLPPARWKPRDLLEAVERVRAEPYRSAVAAGAAEIEQFLDEHTGPLLTD